MNQLDITGYKVTTLVVLSQNLEALARKVQEMEQQRRQLEATLYAELREEGERQGMDVPDGANVTRQGDTIVVTWPETGEGEP